MFKNIIKMLFVALLIVCYTSVSVAGNRSDGNNKQTKLSKKSEFIDYEFLDINNILVYFQNNGNIQDPSGNWSMEFPKKGGTYPIFAAGFALSGFVNGELRASWMASASRSEDWQPGYIDPNTGVEADPNNNLFRIYKYTRNETINDNEDVRDWPAHWGAPYVKVNGEEYPNGGDNYEPESGDLPLLVGDQMVWYVINDGVDLNTRTNNKTEPMKLEAQVTAFSFDQKNVLANAFFVIYKFINRGQNDINEAVFSVWSDPDLGNSDDDLVGVDTTIVDNATRSLAYCYNETNTDSRYGTAPPAVGYDFFLGPKVPGQPTDSIIILGETRKGFKELQMDSFVKYIRDRNDLRDPNNAEESRNYQIGLKFNGAKFDPLTDGSGGVATDNPFIVHPGYPETPVGWIDKEGGDRRMMINTKPFTIASGDTQTIVVGYVAAKGTDNRNAIAKLRDADDALQKVFKLNFKIAGPPPSPKPITARYDEKGTINLTFGTANLPNPQKKDVSGRVITDAPFNYRFNDGLTDKKFKGFRITQYATPNSDEFVNGIINKKELAFIDVNDGYDDIYDLNLDDSTRTKVFKSSTKFTNEELYAIQGALFNYKVTVDAFTGGPFLPGKTYYFGISSLGLDVKSLTPVYSSGNSFMGYKGVAPISESGETRVELTINGAIGEQYVVADTTKFVTPGFDKSLGGANVFVDVVNREVVQSGKAYSIDFKNTYVDTLVYNVSYISRTKDGKSDSTIYALKDISISTDQMITPLVDGLSIRVKKPLPAVTSLSWGKQDQKKLDENHSFFIGNESENVVKGATVVSGDKASWQGIKNRGGIINGQITHDAVKSIKIDFSDSSYAFRYLGNYGLKNLFPSIVVPPDFSPVSTGDSILWAGYTVRHTTENDNFVAIGRLLDKRKPLVGVVKVPFKAYDITTDPANPRQITVGFIENYYTAVEIPRKQTRDSLNNAVFDGKWNPYPSTLLADSMAAYLKPEVVLFSSVSYDPAIFDSSAKHSHFRQFKDIVIRGNSIVSPYGLMWAPLGDADSIPKTQSLEITLNVAKPTDKFIVTAPDNFVDRYLDEVKDAFNKLTIYPNPYIGDNPAEITAVNRFVTMANVPRQATVRIFNLAGQLVRKIEKDDENGLLTWDLRNQYGLYVASGIYLIHVDAKGVGTKVLKFALVQRQEQIDVY